MTHPLKELSSSFHSGAPKGITSVCSAHPIVIEATLDYAQSNQRSVLIEATCNQVNQDGGYTGMTPNDFRVFVEDIAKKVGFDKDRLILGGDHLGPNPWKDLPAKEAMAKAEVMIADYAAAGFTKLHLDTSMGCKDEPVALTDALTAERAAKLAQVAEAHCSKELLPVYVIGTEVPVPGGALEELDVLEVTKPKAALDTYKVHKQAFTDLGLEDAFSRVIGMVVQPGVEFGHSDVIHYDAEKSKALTGTLSKLPGIVFEAHSTDYQTPEGLAELVQNGFGILKVGPWLTFALREGLYGLDNAADAAAGSPPKARLMSAMERLMLAEPQNWEKYYSGNQHELWIQRHFSFSDRIRYYWPNKVAETAVGELKNRLEETPIPQPIQSQYLKGGTMYKSMDEALIKCVKSVLELYDQAI